MRGLKINRMGMGKQRQHTDIATTRPTRPRAALILPATFFQVLVVTVVTVVTLLTVVAVVTEVTVVTGVTMQCSGHYCILSIQCV